MDSTQASKADSDSDSDSGPDLPASTARRNGLVCHGRTAKDVGLAARKQVARLHGFRAKSAKVAQSMSASDFIRVPLAVSYHIVVQTSVAAVIKN